MGNDHSQMSGIEVVEKAVEITDFWSHHTATLTSGNTTNISVFRGEPLIGGALWRTQTPLEKASKSLMIHRHPCILKYISSWSKGSKYYLAVEDVKPLSHVLSTQSTLQTCIGLHSILKALIFLHEKAMASHNNVCTAAIYVTKDGNWKLGGFEYLCKFKDMTQEYMNKSRSHRYNKAVDPNEDKNITGIRQDSVDNYAFGVLVSEVFNKKKSDDLLHSLEDFLRICKDEFLNTDVTKRPKLSSLLVHPFFNHEFIYIHSFLTELPLKKDSEKNEFFSTLIEKLHKFDERTIASQLGDLLLSRMVLLNKCAQESVIGFILNPKADSDEESKSLFTMSTFKTYITSKLLEIFCVRDAQIRLLLLEHFKNYITAFTKQELQTHVLPELLVGIKDTNDHLVAITLRALSDLVPILGAATVIGGKRAKLFNDGRPIVHANKPCSRRNSMPNQEINQNNFIDPFSANESINNNENIVSTDTISNNDTASNVDNSNNLDLPERPSPDGEEGDTSTDEIITAEEEPEEVWDDWEINEDSQDRNNEESLTLEPLEISVDATITHRKKSLPDIFELDIKNQKNLTEEKLEEINFFQDMEPVIETSSKFLIEQEDRNTGLNLNVCDEHNEEEGWGDDLEWGD